MHHTAPNQTSSAPQQPESAPARRWSKLDAVYVVIVFLVTFAAFANSLGNAFVYDDTEIIQTNPRLNQPWRLHNFFGTSYWGDPTRTALYRPLTILSFAADRAVFGPGPFGVHFVNVLMNALVAALAFVFVRELTGRRAVALAAALLYGLHPVHSEVVANGVGRAELGAAMCALGALILHLIYVRRAEAMTHRTADAAVSMPAVRRMPWTHLALAGACFLYLLSLLFKESTVTLPGAVFLMEWLILARGQIGVALRRFGRVAVYAVPLAAYFALRISVIGVATPAPVDLLAGLSAGQRALFGSESILRYVGQLFVPWQLCADYSDYANPPHPTWLEPVVLVSLVHWAAVGLLAYWAFRTRRWTLLFGVAAFYLALLPVSNLLIPLGTIRSDRLLYWPSLGFAIALACFLAELARVRRVPPIGLAVAILLFYAGKTVLQNRNWHDERALWSATTRDNPGCATAWFRLGENLRISGDDAQAESAYRRAFELRDAAGLFYPEAHTSYASMLERRGDNAGAAAQRSLVADHYRHSGTGIPDDFSTLLNLGATLIDDAATRGQGIAYLKRAIDLSPGDFRGHANLAAAYSRAGDARAALASLEEAIRLRPDIANLWEGKAKLLAELGQPDAAEAARREAQRLRKP